CRQTAMLTLQLKAVLTERTHTHTRSEEHTSELQSHLNLVCRLLLEKKHTGPPTRRPTYHYAQPRSAITQHARHRARRRATAPRRRSRAHAHLTLLFFFNDTATTEIYTLSLHDALPI